ncbi:MAG: amidohydrolase family protein [Proteobacteria bacterium]|nr:amidohydrolase family protein [Pseudomonadota bacterium]
MSVAYLALPVFIALPAITNAQSELIALQPDRIFSGENLYESGEWLLIQEGYVVEIVSTEAELPAEAYKQRLKGKTIIPALIDAHAHLGYQSVNSWGAENYNEANLLDNLSLYAYYGFSTVFSAGSDPVALINELRATIDLESMPVATPLAAYGVAPTGYGPNNSFLDEIRTVEAALQTNILFGVDQSSDIQTLITAIEPKQDAVIKIWVDDRAGTQPKLSQRLYTELVSNANQQGIKVVAHQQDSEDTARLVQAGVAGFLHGRLDDEISEGLSRSLAESSTFVIPNLGLSLLRRMTIAEDPFLYEALPAATLSRLSDRVFAGTADALSSFGPNHQLDRQLENLIENLEPSIRKSFESAIEHGVPIILGTDAGALPDHFFGYSGHKELEIFVALGMSPEQAIAAATSSAASQLGLYDRGLLEKGLRADFLILNANPLSDIRATQDISAIFLLGKELDRTAIIERLTQDLRN